MGLKDLIDRLKGMTNHEDELDPADAKPYKVDRYLESLRIERQRQLEAEEKLRLKQAITNYKKQQIREHMFGIKDRREREKTFLKAKRKECNILKNRGKWL